MAHFARVDSGIVREVVRVDDSVLDPDSTGIEDEALGAAFLADLLGGTWVQTSYTASSRGKYAGIGFRWDGTEFLAPSE